MTNEFVGYRMDVFYDGREPLTRAWHKHEQDWEIPDELPEWVQQKFATLHVASGGNTTGREFVSIEGVGSYCVSRDALVFWVDVI